MGKYINRLKGVFAEQHKTNIWLVQELDKDLATVFKWCTNTAKSELETLTAFVECLNVYIRYLNSSNEAIVAEPSIPYISYEGK